MKKTTKGKILKVSGVVIDVAAPLAATLTQFPVWIGQGTAQTMSGLFIVAAFLSCVPFIKQLKQYFKSPSSWVMWSIVLVLLVAVRNICDEMIIVAFVGLLGNAAGAGLYKVGERYDPKTTTIIQKDGE